MQNKRTIRYYSILIIVAKMKKIGTKILSSMWSNWNSYSRNEHLVISYKTKHAAAAAELLQSCSTL